MGYLSSLGANSSKTTFLALEDGKIAVEFEVAAGQDLKSGQPVKLDATGKVTLWAPADLLTSLIGYVYNDGAAGALITVFCRGFAIIYALANDQDAGPASYASYDTTNAVANNNQQSGAKGYSRYINEATAGEIHAWILDQITTAANTQLTRVLLMD